MPAVLKRLAVVQFFTWFGLFALWIYAGPVVARALVAAGDTLSGSLNVAANWVGVLFAIYNGVAALVALALPAISARIGARAAYALCLLCGAAGLSGFVFLPASPLLWIAAVGIGFAWAAILSLPYAIIVNAVAPEKVGVYLGIHNIFLVIPQLVAAILLGPMVAHFFDGDPTPALGVAASFLAVAAAAVLFIPPARD